MEGLTDAGVRSARPGPFGSCYPTARPEHGEGAARKAASPTTERDRGHQNPAKRCLRPRRTCWFRPTPRSLITTATHECEGTPRRGLSALRTQPEMAPATNPPFETGGVDNMSIKAIAQLSQVRGGSQARIMLADDGKKYVVKYQGNPQCTRVLANDYLACRLARMIGLSVPESVIILVDEDTIREQGITFTLAGRAVAARPGLQFGSALVTGEVLDWLPGTMLGRVRNLRE